ncbi:MAG TPA: TspO/MBR family protein [Chitinophagales bacterium]|nr:TspO/MBR family protein [Chitinophagales bacterium]
MNKAMLFFICLIIPLCIGGLSGVLTATEITGWYKNAIKPSFNPPNYVFGPVWTLLYALMGVSLFMVMNATTGTDRTIGLALFATQITLNFFWSILFFKFHQPGWALLEMAFLWVAIAAMIIYFFKVAPIAGLLQIPYLCWVSFATILTLSFWQLN